VAHLAGAHEFAHRADRLLDRRIRVDAMQVIQVDDLDGEALEARVARGAHVFGPAVERAPLRVGRIALKTELGREHDLVAAALERAPEELFVRVRAVDIGRVEQRDAEVERMVDRGDRFGVVARSVELAHAHATQAERGNFGAVAAESTRAHVHHSVESSVLWSDRGRFKA